MGVRSGNEARANEDQSKRADESVFQVFAKSQALLLSTRGASAPVYVTDYGSGLVVPSSRIFRVKLVYQNTGWETVMRAFFSVSGLIYSGLIYVELVQR